MKSSCISHPESEKLFRKWQVVFCDGNKCAAAVLSYLEYWHNFKLYSGKYNNISNDISDLVGKSENFYQYHSLAQISEGTLNLYGIKPITEAMKLLVAKKAITTQVNSNRNHIDGNTKCIRFYPEVCNEWIKNHYKKNCRNIIKTNHQNNIFNNSEVVMCRK